MTAGSNKLHLNASQRRLMDALVGAAGNESRIEEVLANLEGGEGGRTFLELRLGLTDGQPRSRREVGNRMFYSTSLVERTEKSMLVTLQRRRRYRKDFRTDHPFDIGLFALYDPTDLSLIEVWEMVYDDIQRLVNRNLRRNSLRWPKVREHAHLRYQRDEDVQSG